jgi:hypothetical protein
MKNVRAGALKRAEKKAVSLVRGHFKKIKRSTKKRGTKKRRSGRKVKGKGFWSGMTF